jgi:hypothetical protein
VTQETLDLVDDEKVFAVPEPNAPFWPDALAILSILMIATVFVIAVKGI